jgi:hypothetical protein
VAVKLLVADFTLELVLCGMFLPMLEHLFFCVESLEKKRNPKLIFDGSRGHDFIHDPYLSTLRAFYLV